MHPAFSVIAFTTLSGAGYGLLFLLGLAYARAPLPLSRELALLLVGLATLLVLLGLLSSLLHLGQPRRAWRALSQWRSSWLSREGVAASASLVPVAALALLVWRAEFGVALRLSALAIAALALLTVYCTARIYTSLRAIPAWTDRAVLPAYLLIGLWTGALLGWALLAPAGIGLGRAPAIAMVLTALAIAALKLGYWRRLAAATLPDAGAVTGLRRLGRVRQLEAPHTEANYLTREMGFVLARRHAARLRRIALVLLVASPLACIGWACWSGAGIAAPLVAAASALLGALVERWLFFAEARHVVMAYYGAPGGPA
jgi:sulfite dehydrogenase (quinone) subunit SoeC